MNYCPGQVFHDNLAAHEREIIGMKNVENFKPLACWRHYRDRKNRFGLLYNYSSTSLIQAIEARPCKTSIKDMAYNFAACDRNQPYLFPPSLTDRLGDNHLAWFVIEAVEHIDIKPFFTKYRADGIGNTAFNPTMMAALLIYAYCKGERSSRQIEKYCGTDVAYRVISANQIPSTISRFRKDNEQHLKGLFLEILKL